MERPRRGSGTANPCAPAVLRTMVAEHRPFDEREARSRDRILEELSRLARPWDREAGLVHVTASGVVAGPRGTLLHWHRRLRRWLQPGGHIEAGAEDPAQPPGESQMVRWFDWDEAIRVADEALVGALQRGRDWSRTAVVRG